jgi:leader peptidase (prepilin peptidase) / N-methyltransferase
VTAVSAAVSSALVVATVLGLGAGYLANRLAARFPWGNAHETAGPAVRPPLVEVGTALLFALTAVRFGWSWELPAFLFLAGTAVLLTVVDLQHQLLPNRIVLPSIGIAACLLAVAALGTGEWPPLLRAVEAAAVLYVVFVVLVLISPRSIGMGDAKLAALLGLYLGWLGWDIVLLGIAAGFVVQAVLAGLLLATRRIGLKGQLPFGPAMLVGAALVIGWSDALVV